MGNVIQQCKTMGLAVGDAIQGREEYGDGWSETRLTLVWMGDEIAVWSVDTRSNRHPKWQHQGESASWTLECREWRKVLPSE